MRSLISERSLCAVALLLLVALAPVPAAAQTAEQTAQARTALKQGATLLQKRQYQQALARFQEAYGLVPTPKIHYNFGLAYLGLERNPEALESFEAFLREFQDPPPVQRLKATEQIEQLKQKVMQLSVTCNVEGAKVVIDGRLRGLTPLPRAIPLDPGAHQLLVEKEGSHDPALRSVFGAAGQTIQTTIDLKSKPDDRPLAIAAPVSEPAPLLRAEAPPPEPTPLYKNGWFWTGVGVVAAAAVVGSILLFSSSDPAAVPCPMGVDGCLTVP